MKVKSQKSKVKNVVVFILYTLYFILYTPFAYATDPSPGPFNIGERFGFGSIKSLGQATSKLMVPVFSIATTLVIVYFIFGTFDYIKSGGNKEEVAKARAMITHSIVGFILLMFCFFILQFLLSSLLGNTGINIINTQ